MKKAFLTALLTATVFSYSQEQNNQNKWLFGFGINVLNNNVLQNKEFFSLKDINFIPTISALSLQRKFSNNLSLEGQIFLNQFQKENLHNGKSIDRSNGMASINLNTLYTYDSHLVDVKWFDASVLLGLGAIWTDDTSNQTFNTGMVFDFWLSEKVALRLETQGRFAFDNNKLANNHIIHALSIIVCLE
ncbi:hypothetical protein [Flavobacterium sp.]|uniref:hypothetical protein n=1 Tax=Flavobacterium sp. TaxID=239 RepID=UPI0035AFC64B